MADPTPAPAAHDEPACPACGHVHDDRDCECGCEYDASFCGRCGWLDCECDPEEDDDEA